MVAKRHDLGANLLFKWSRRADAAGRGSGPITPGEISFILPQHIAKLLPDGRKGAAAGERVSGFEVRGMALRVT